MDGQFLWVMYGSMFFPCTPHFRINSAGTTVVLDACGCFPLSRVESHVRDVRNGEGCSRVVSVVSGR